MSDELLPYYHNELAFLRRLGRDFGEAHPKIAGRLRLTDDGSDDPHVARLIEAFAFLTARVRYKLDDDLPELTDSLLGVLYPHYTRPIPAMAIAQFVLDRSQGELTAGYTIPTGTQLETDLVDGEPCRFRTGYDVTLWPVQVDAASLTGVPFTAPPLRAGQDVLGVLRLALGSFAKEIGFSQMPIDRLRFYLRGQPQHVYPLYEMLHNNVLGIALATGPKDPSPIPLKPGAIQPVGFEQHQGLLPYGPQSFPGYRLLTEYFAFPEKFLFFDLLLDRKLLAKAGSRLEVFVYLNRTEAALERNITADTFQLGCTPMVNLYEQRAEPIVLNQTQTEYRIVPDARRPLAHEVYSIGRVTATSPDQEVLEYKPFYSIKHADRRDRPLFWHSRRTRPRGAGQRADQGTEIYISLVDLGFQVTAPANWTLDVETTCLNRDLPHRAELGPNQGRFHMTEGAPVSKVVCLTPPTQTHRPATKHAALWRAISHLSLNHLSLADNEEGASALREILKLYNFAESSESRSMIEGVASVRSRRVVGRTGTELAGGFCKGCEITVQFDEDRFAGSGVYLLASVLERFFALYCSINSFTKMVATTNRRDGVLRRWPPRAGDKILV